MELFSCVQCYTNFISEEVQSKVADRWACFIYRCSVEFDPQEYYHLFVARQWEIINRILLFRT